ncbi:hypothetical protein Tco_0409129 [Tanacetum coccineum]
MSSYNHPSCSCCGGPFNGGNCPSCSSVGSGNEFVYDPNPYSYNETPNFFNQPPHYSPSQYETYSCEFCRNDAYYGYDCPPQVPFVYNQDPCFNQNFDNFPQTSPNFQQQYLCCENCGGPHETFQCQPLNQNFYEPNHGYNSNSFGFDQSQPPQFPVIHQPPQETSVEILQARENLMKSIQTFLKKFDRISFRETPKVLLLAWEKFFEIKHACRKKQHQPEDIQELLHKLLKDVQIISEELADYINTPNWNCPAFYEDDDEEYTIAITPVLLNLWSPRFSPLCMGDVQLSTILENGIGRILKSYYERLKSSPKIDFVSGVLRGENSPHISFDGPPGIDSLMEEIDLFLTPDDSMPPGIEIDGTLTLKEDILFLKTCLANDSPFTFCKLKSISFDVHRPSIVPGIMKPLVARGFLSFVHSSIQYLA